jgi:predicted DNA repair protein MutK
VLFRSNPDPRAVENAKVAGAIRTDMILSAEIMAITLASVPAQSFAMQAIVLAVVGIGITVVVYGAVALIVKADDLGVLMARGHLAVTRALGRGLVKGMPGLLKLLGLVGTAAMLWVGGGIIVYGAAGLGWSAPEHALQEVAAKVAALLGAAGGFTAWLVSAIGTGILGIAVGAVVALAMSAIKGSKH